MARIAAVLRRTSRSTVGGGAGSAATYRSRALEIAFDESRVRLNGVELPCTPTEYQLLRLLAERAGSTVRQEEALRRVWGAGYEQDTAVLQTAVWRLRRKLSEDPRAPRYLRTVRGLGYQLPASDPAG